MNCPACQHENRPGAKFCEECASPLRLVCAGCGEELRPTAKFCDECGAPTGRAPSTDDAAASASDTSRRIVTVVFADLAGSTALHERLDAESARLFMENYYAAMRRVIDEHGGRVAKLLGDGVMAVFGLPLVGEDDALRAVRAAVSMQRAFAELAEQYAGLVGKVGLRVAANTGEVVTRDDSELIGDPVNVAARLQDQAGDGDVVVGESTRRLLATQVTLEPLGSLTLKGRAEAVAAHRVVSLDPPKSVTTAAFVGRDEELTRLTAVFDDAVQAPRTKLAVLLGSPGLGKSRLIEEFSTRVGAGAAIVNADCEAAGSATFAPLASALREFLGVPEGGDSGEPGQDLLREAVEAVIPETFAERDRIRDGAVALLRGSPAPPEEAFFVIRRLLAAIASTRPLVLVIDDLQWASPLLLDLIEHLVQWGSGTPLFVLVGARPELRDLRSSLTARSSIVSDAIALAGLDAGAAMRLAANVIGASDLPAAAAARVLAASEGNPLFVGELVRMLVHEGALEHDGERWTVGAGLASLEMPPTIHALLASRIERLRPEERVVLERAAVVGRQFSRSAVAHLLPDQTRDLDASLESLRRSELIESDTGWLLGEPVLRFHHLLIRDAAYRRLLKNTRAELHARLAEWIEAKAAGAAEHDEIIGWHLEQAFHHLGQLGPVTAQARELGARASARLSAAGRRSLARDDLPVAADLLGRALACLDHADPARADLALDWCEALLSAGEVGRAGEAVEELARFASDSPRLKAWHACMAGQLRALTEPRSLQTTADAVAAAAREFADLEDVAGEAKAHAVHAQALARLGRVGDSEEALDRALAAARRAGDRRRANAVLTGAPQAALWGPSPVTRASGRCLDVVRVLRITHGAPAVEAVALSCQGVLEALRGRTDAARRMVATARELVEELGIAHRLFEADVCTARIDLLEGKAADAEKLLGRAYDGLRELGLDSDAAQAGALLARALLAQGRGGEAEEISAQCEALAGDDLQAAIAWRAVRAEALALRGEQAEAIALAEAGVAIASATDALLDHAVARLALAAAFASAGREGDAKEQENRARELWEAKGAVWTRGGEAGLVPGSVVEGATTAAAGTRRRILENLATENFRHFADAINAGDIDRYQDLFHEAVRIIHHPTGREYGKASILDDIRSGNTIPHPFCRIEVLASLGETLALCRSVLGGEEAESGAAVPFGAFEIERLFLQEVSADGRRLYVEVFESSHLDRAVVRLYELRAEQAPRRRERLLALAGAFAGVARADFSGFSGSLPDGFSMSDHRRVIGLGERLGTEAITGTIRALEELTSESAWRIDDVLALTDEGGVQLLTNSGTLRDGGGRFERSFLSLYRFDEQGRLELWEIFDPEDREAALARFDEVVAAGSDASPFENRAVRTARRSFEHWVAGNWEALAGDCAEDFRLSDRRRLMQLELDRDGWVEFSRTTEAMQRRGSRLTLLATRGDRLCINRPEILLQDGDAGPSEVAMLDLVEIDPSGSVAAIVRFDVDDLGAAFEELERRFDALEPSASLTFLREFERCFLARDWQGIRQLSAPELRGEDHRLVSWGRLDGVDALVTATGSLVEMAPDTTLRVEHVRISGRMILLQNTWRGTREGGAFESPFLCVFELNENAQAIGFDLFDVHRHEDARARFEQRPAGGDSLRIPPNQASRAFERWMDCVAAGDREGIRKSFAPSGYHADDRRKVLGLNYDRAMAEAHDDWMISQGARLRATLLATAGEQLALFRAVMILPIDGDAKAPAEIEVLEVVEVDSEGRFVADVVFDVDDRAAACDEMSRREIPDGVPSGVIAFREYVEAWNRHDIAAFRRLIPEDYVFDDHRLTGVGRLEGREVYLASLEALFELSPDIRLEQLYEVAMGPHAGLGAARWSGTNSEGGDFEAVHLFLGHTDGEKVRGAEIFEMDDIEAALARLEELGGTGSDEETATGLERLASTGARMEISALGWRDPGARKLVDRLRDALRSGLTAGDWDPLRRLVSEDFRWEDRGRRALVEGDVETWIASLRFVFEQPALTLSFGPIASLGRRVGVNSVRWWGGVDGNSFEMEKLQVLEWDAEDRARSVLLFDVDQRPQAFQEALRRFAAGEGASSQAAGVWAELSRRYVASDWPGLLDCLRPDFVFDDHRPLSFGTLDREAWLASLKVQAELAPERAGETTSVLGWGERGIAVEVRASGLLASGGPYENVFLLVCIVRKGRVARVEIHPEADREVALKRLQELDETAAGIPATRSFHEHEPSTRS